jgi:signal peptidase
MRFRGIAATGVRRLLDLAQVVLVAVCLSALILARVVPMTGRGTFVVAGASMTPAIPLGSAVIVEPVSSSALAVGDIVTLHSGEGRAVFTHRISRIAEREGAVWVETKGDANAWPDPSITPATAIVGRVTTYIPVIGFVIAWLSLPSGIVSVLAIGFALQAATWLLARRPEPLPPSLALRPSSSFMIRLEHG